MKLSKLLASLWLGRIIFIFVLFVMFFYYNLNETMFDPPQSVHVWRQTNCLSLTHNYYQDNLPLFKPEMHNQFGNGGTSGKAVGEFPIIYYLIAQLWKIFGNHEWIFKLIQITILFLGLVALFETLSYLIKNQFWAGFISLIVFTSPMVAFYGPNFLPDVPALSFVFIAWYFIARFLQRRKIYNIWLSAIFFCIAMLLKITSAISFVALGGYVVFELLFQNSNKRIFRFKLKHFIPFLICILPVLSWYIYADYYNTVNQGHFSVHGIWPIWETTKENFNRIIDIQRHIYFKQLFLPFAQYLTIVIWILLLFLFKQTIPAIRYFSIVLPVGFILQVALWFQVLDYHDYYMINLIVVLVAVWAMFIIWLKKTVSKNYLNYLLYGLALAFLFWNIVTCKKSLDIRYMGWMNAKFNNYHNSLLYVEPLFKELGVNKEDKVISLPDGSLNATLYYMNRKGYTNFGSDFSKDETFFKRIEQGAKYLIINDSTILSSEVIQPFIKNKIGEYKNILVYDIQEVKQVQSK